MRKVSRSALVPYSAREMFVIVDDVEAYPEFLPWCNDAQVRNRCDDTVEATLELHKGALSNHFTTLNTRHEFTAIDLSLVGGPFKYLEGGWQFKDLGDDGSKVILELDFQFKSMLVDMVFGAFFEDTCNSMVDAFARRAVQIFGERPAGYAS
ncbi:MAG: type II toxin-antitoxin system RatA family toxin [Proteobacteria bacterium]|nr:type II toxin-antitoxin system RatA family toxin [Pseudomonadota bacterium]